MMKITIQSSVGIGDVIVLSPLVRKLKSLYPDSQITVISRRGGFLKDIELENVDKVVHFDTLSKTLGIFMSRQDLFLSLGYFPSSTSCINKIAYYTFAYLFPAAKKVILRNLDSDKYLGKSMNEIQLCSLAKLGVEIERADKALFIPFSYHDELSSIQEKLSQGSISADHPMAVFHVGRKKGFENSLWDIHKWIRVIEHLQEIYDANVVFIGSEPDRGIVIDINQELQVKCLDFTGKLTIQETVALIDRSDLFVSTNSGPMWIAAALNKPQIALCGPAKKQWYPKTDGIISVYIDIKREGCMPPCDARSCRYNDRLCMDLITEHEVMDALDKILEGVHINANSGYLKSHSEFEDCYLTA